MKKILFGSLAAVLAIAFVSFTNAETKSSKFVCKWFVYNKTGQAYPTTEAEAKVQTDYRALLGTESISLLCPDTEKLCAICVENTTTIAGVVRPVIAGDQVENKIHLYFTGTNDPNLVDFQGFIAEKAFLPFAVPDQVYIEFVR